MDVVNGTNTWKGMPEQKRTEKAMSWESFIQKNITLTIRPKKCNFNPFSIHQKCCCTLLALLQRKIKSVTGSVERSLEKGKEMNASPEISVKISENQRGNEMMVAKE